MASTYNVVTVSTPAAMAKGKSFSGFLSSPDANPTLFQASIENSEPTIAAPTTGRMASVRAPPDQKVGPKFAVIAAAFRPIVNPSKIRAASAAVLIAVSEVWMNAAVRTPRTLIHVSSTIDAMAKIRWRENPTMMSPMGCGKCTVVPSGTSGVSQGQSTEVKRANATATAAIVPVWITTNSVQPYR